MEATKDLQFEIDLPIGEPNRDAKMFVRNIMLQCCTAEPDLNHIIQLCQRLYKELDK